MPIIRSRPSPPGDRSPAPRHRTEVRLTSGHLPPSSRWSASGDSVGATTPCSRLAGMRRDHWKRRNDALDPATDFVEIYANVVGHEFPWDMNQALGFALFRTYAVPGIGRLLDETGQFTEQTAEAVRRHRAAPRAADPAGVRGPRGQGRDPADQPDAPGLRHPRPRVPLRAEHLRRRPQALAGRLRQAPADGQRGRGVGAVLPDARAAHEHQGHPGDVRRLRGADGLLRGRALRLRRGRAPGRRLHARADGGLPAPDRPPGDGHLQPVADGPAAARRLRVRRPAGRRRGALARRAQGARRCCCGPSRRAGPEADRGPAADPQLPRRLRRRAARHLPGARASPGCPVRARDRAEPAQVASAAAWATATHQRPARSSSPGGAAGRLQRAGQPGVAEQPVEGDLARRSAPRPTVRRTPARRRPAGSPSARRGRRASARGAGRRSPAARRPRRGRRCRRRRSRSSRTRARRRAPRRPACARSPLAQVVGVRRPRRRAPRSTASGATRAQNSPRATLTSSVAKSAQRRARRPAARPRGLRLVARCSPARASASSAAARAAAGRRTADTPANLAGADAPGTAPRRGRSGTAVTLDSRDPFREGLQGLPRPGQRRARHRVGRHREGRVRLPRRHVGLRQVDLPAAGAARGPPDRRPGLRRRQGDQPARQLEGAADAPPDRHRLPGLPAAAPTRPSTRTSPSRSR